MFEVWPICWKNITEVEAAMIVAQQPFSKTHFRTSGNLELRRNASFVSLH